MRLAGTEVNRANALVGTRGKHFVGYAVRTTEGWVCVAQIGISWTRSTCRSQSDARTCLMATGHASTFEWLSSVDDLNALIIKLPPYAQPSILPDSIVGILSTPKLGQGEYVRLVKAS